jgi:thiosulfate reductase cytochrome b subunit
MAAAEPAQLGGVGMQIPDALRTPRHSAVVRVTHWINTVSFLGLLISGFAILLAHPRFYWGEAGGLGTPSLLDLPLPFMKGGPSGWGRNLHFLSAWACVINGSVYILSGILTRHFLKNLLLAKTDLSWVSIQRVIWSHLRLERPGVETSLAYNLVQKFTYLVVVFVLLPLMIWTGFAMSPAIVSVLPSLVTSLGGQESARTIHFFAADFLALFLLVHIAMVYLAGFTDRVRTMITGRAARVEHT